MISDPTIPDGFIHGNAVNNHISKRKQEINVLLMTFMVYFLLNHKYSFHSSGRIRHWQSSIFH